jgi:hypothetical protein
MSSPRRRLTCRVFLATTICLMAIAAGPKRQWQTGTLVDAGRKHNNAIGGAVSETRRPMNPGIVPTPRETPEVATYVIETAEVRLHLEAMVPVAGSDFERQLVVGQAVTFALEKKNVYVKLADGREHRLRVVSKSPKKEVAPRSRQA